eukprot:231574_1
MAILLIIIASVQMQSNHVDVSVINSVPVGDFKKTTLGTEHLTRFDSKEQYYRQLQEADNASQLVESIKVIRDKIFILKGLEIPFEDLSNAEQVLQDVASKARQHIEDQTSEMRHLITKNGNLYQVLKASCANIRNW